DGDHRHQKCHNARHVGHRAVRAISKRRRAEAGCGDERGWRTPKSEPAVGIAESANTTQPYTTEKMMAQERATAARERRDPTWWAAETKEERERLRQKQIQQHTADLKQKRNPLGASNDNIDEGHNTSSANGSKAQKPRPVQPPPTARGGGVNIAGGTRIDGDVVGRDKVGGVSPNDIAGGRTITDPDEVERITRAKLRAKAREAGQGAEEDTHGGGRSGGVNFGRGSNVIVKSRVVDGDLTITDGEEDPKA
ncbi:MAG TPA: hypothetical protein VIK33_01065, partial [Anaerolineae bacterium]